MGKSYTEDETYWNIMKHFKAKSRSERSCDEYLTKFGLGLLLYVRMAVMEINSAYYNHCRPDVFGDFS